jgi:hypothetical protein
MRGMGEAEMDLNLAQQPRMTGHRKLLEKRIHKTN